MKTKTVAITIAVAIIAVAGLVTAGWAIDSSDGSIDAFDDDKWAATGEDGLLEPGDPGYEATTTTTSSPTTTVPMITTTLPITIGGAEQRTLDNLLAQTDAVLAASTGLQAAYPAGEVPVEASDRLSQMHEDVGAAWRTYRDQYADSPLAVAYGRMANGHSNYAFAYQMWMGTGEYSDDNLYSGRVSIDQGTYLILYFEQHGEAFRAPHTLPHDPFTALETAALVEIGQANDEIDGVFAVPKLSDDDLVYYNEASARVATSTASSLDFFFVMYVDEYGQAPTAKVIEDATWRADTIQAMYTSYDNADHCNWFPVFAETIIDESTTWDDLNQWTLASILTDDQDVFLWFGGCYVEFMEN